MTSQSERTFVPPVTALRSPPDSRITGALSPVIALSSTEAIPSITSPSAGMRSPASTRTYPPSAAPSTGPSQRPSGAALLEALCRRVRRALRRAWAWAFPRPSASASGRLAKRTVNQSQSETAPMNHAGASPAPERLDPEDRRHHASDLDDEHHGVPRHGPRVQLHERIDHRLAAGLPSDMPGFGLGYG